MIKRGPASFIAGFATAAVLLGGVAMAGDVLWKDIRVAYTPLKYYFDGAEKVPPGDQQGFIYNGRTYVPLRFMVESLGKDVNYDPETTSIFVGRRPGPLPEFWSNLKTEGDAAFKLQFFEKGAQTLTGQGMANSVLISAISLAATAPDQQNATARMTIEYALPAGSKSVSGTLFVPDHYFGQAGERKIGRVLVLNENNQTLYQSHDLTSASGSVPFSIPVELHKRVRLIFSLYPNQGLPTGEGMVTTQLGVSDLQVK